MLDASFSISSNSFDFASSNEMWRATMEVLDFVPLVNADYGGGIIITDWYSEDTTQNQSVKISVQFLVPTTAFKPISLATIAA